MKAVVRATLVGCGAALGGIALPAQEPTAKVPAYLERRIGLSPEEVAAVERGDAIVTLLDAESKRDVGLFGVVRIDVPLEFSVARLQDFPNSLRAPTRPRFGIFQEPAKPRDVEGVTVPRREVDDLKTCRPGDCKIKMPATDMQRLHSDIDWSVADPSTQLSAYLRRRLIEYVTDYRAHGDSAMMVYDDRGGVHASDAFAALVAQTPYVYEDIPSLRQYLIGYPHASIDGAREVLYWAVDSASGLKPILSVTHTVVYPPPEYPGVTVVASKQIYANHYFEGVLDVTALIDRPTTTGKRGIYLADLRRFRFDDLPTGPMNIRGKVMAKLRDQMKIDLGRQKAALEQAFRSSP